MKVALVLSAAVCTVGVGASLAESAPPPPVSTGQEDRVHGATTTATEGNSNGTAPATAGPKWPASVTRLTLGKGKKIAASGSLASGQKIPGLSLPTSCIAAADKDKYFAGNTALFAAEIPARADLTITVTPTDANQKLSVYAYVLPAGKSELPGQVTAPMSCKSTFKSAWRGNDEQRSVKLSGGKDSRTVVIGVTGPSDVTAGDFTLTIDAH